MAANNKSRKVRYAVVGLGHIAQVAVLPAFAHAARNSVLTALLSNDPDKLKKLSRRYGVAHTYSYEEYDDCLRSGDVDAVYIALPNNMHAEYSIRGCECRCPYSVRKTDGRHRTGMPVNDPRRSQA